MPNKRRWVFQRLALAAGAFLLALALGELLARVLAPEPPNVRFQIVTERGEARGHHQLVRVILENDPALFWRLKPNLTLPETDAFFPGVVSNSQGLREDHEISLTKPPGEIRILFVGDSCTFGWGVKQEQSLAGYVEQSLRSRFPGLAIECINAGVPAYSLFQGWRFLETEGYKYEPDLVVVNFGTNDMVAWSGQSDFEHYRDSLAALPPTPLRWSRLCQLFWRATRSAAPIAASPDAATGTAAEGDDLDPGSADPNAEPTPSGEKPTDKPLHRRVPAGEFAYLLKLIHDETAKRGIELLLIVWPYDWNLNPPAERRTQLQLVLYTYSKLRMSFGPDRAPGHIDLVPVVRDLARELPASDIFKDPLHTTAAANRRFADAIVERVTPWVEERARAGGRQKPARD